MVRDLASEKEWKIRFKEYKKSGLSINAWCTKNGFKATTFHYWIKKFKAPEQIVPAVKAQFAEVILPGWRAVPAQKLMPEFAYIKGGES